MFIKAADISLEVKKTPSKKVNTAFKHKRKWKKWFDQECKEQKDITRRLAILKHKHPEDNKLKTEHNKQLKIFKKLCGKKKLEFDQKQIQKISDMTNDQNEFWNEWKHFDDSVYTTEQFNNADGKKWESYFSQLYDDPTSTNMNIERNESPDQVHDRPINAMFTEEELDQTISKLKVKKAGKGKILTEFIKASPDPTRKLLLKMINTIYSTNIVPRSWCLGIITPIHKEGPKDDPDNYRGICIGSALSKVLSTMMNQRLTDFAKENNLIHKSQIGFQEKNRTSDHILTTKTLVNRYVNDKKGKLYACFIDLKKAFDSVWHQGLFHKLEMANLKGNFLNTLKDMYKKTECAVKLGGRTTQYFKCKKGVRQGDPLSPLLFNIFINGVFERLKDNNCDPVTLIDRTEEEEDNINDYFNALAYADDIVLFSTTKEGLQKALDTTQQYCNEWRLKINHKKTKCMTFTRGTQKEKTTFNIEGMPLENVKDYKYLGILINKKNCTFVPALKALRIKATRALYAIKGKVNISQLPIRVALKLFDALIKPILLYASETWEPFLNYSYEKWDYEEIEKVHLHFIKQIMGVNRSTTNILVRGDINRHCLQLDILKRNIKYLRYINEKDDNTIVKQAYRYELERNQPITLLSTLKKYEMKLQQAHGQFFPYKYPHENILDISEDKLKIYTKEIHDNIWKEKLGESTKGRTYRGFKTHMQYEPLLDLLPRKLRRTMLKFRLSDHKLMIEEGRHKIPQIPAENRWCKFCETEVEDEEHMLIDCKLQGNRTEWFNEIITKYPNFNTLDNHQKFIYLMSQENDQLIQDTAEKIAEWQDLRQLILSNFLDPKPPAPEHIAFGPFT